MTNNTLKTANPEELKSLIDSELAAYAIRLNGHDTDWSATPDARGDLPRKMYLGAIEQIAAASLFAAMITLKEKIEQGYKIVIAHHPVHEITHTGGALIYVLKPDAVQVQDIAVLTAEITEKYNAEIDNFNTKLLAEQAAAEKLALEKEVNRRLAVKQEEERQAMLAVVMAELSAEATTKPAKKAAK